jgi:hypothetical protein
LAYCYGRFSRPSPDLTLAVTYRTIRDGLDSVSLGSTDRPGGTVLGVFSLVPFVFPPLQTACHGGEVACFGDSHNTHWRWRGKNRQSNAYYYWKRSAELGMRVKIYRRIMTRKESYYQWYYSLRTEYGECPTGIALCKHCTGLLSSSRAKQPERTGESPLTSLSNLGLDRIMTPITPQIGLECTRKRKRNRLRDMLSCRTRTQQFFSGRSKLQF